jgi:hypothetical protein
MDSGLVVIHKLDASERKYADRTDIDSALGNIDGRKKIDHFLASRLQCVFKTLKHLERLLGDSGLHAMGLNFMNRFVIELISLVVVIFCNLRSGHGCNFLRMV